MQNLLCKLVGHKPPVYAKKGWWSPGEEYGKLRYTGKDNIGREHAEVVAECARCQEKFVVARVSIPTNRKV